MTRVFRDVFLTILVSLYFFPFEFSFLQGINTKMILATVGLVLLGINIAISKSAQIDKSFFSLSFIAGLMSLVGLFSITYNNTPDTSYATYIVSMWVWFGGAYTVYYIIKKLNGECSIMSLGYYLTLVCVTQCVLALVIEANADFKMFVDHYIEQGQDFLNKNNVKRLYGIGASLDVAGSRFSTVLIIIAFILTKIEATKKRKYIGFYLMAFFIITIIGNMVARTTTVGLLLSLGYWAYSFGFKNINFLLKNKRLIVWSMVLLCIAVSISSYLYNTDLNYRKKFEFAFEGFFSLVRNNEWNVSSNEKLKTMYVFPETMKTWMIGDGYFSNPRDVDPMFIGKDIGGYYMGTDAGYLRFIYYFGIIGLILFMYLFYKCFSFCKKKYPEYGDMFLLLLLANYVIWIKVATDILLVFALLFMVEREEEEEYQRQIAFKR